MPAPDGRQEQDAAAIVGEQPDKAAGWGERKLCGLAVAGL